MSDDARADGPRRARPARTARESFGTIALGLEAFVVFLATLVIWGLSPAPFGDGGIPSWVVLVIGGALIVLVIAAVPLLTHPAGVVIGWTVPAVLVVGGLLNPALAIVGVAFGALWWYCMSTGDRLDRQKREIDAAFAASEADGAEPGPQPTDSGKEPQ